MIPLSIILFFAHATKKIIGIMKAKVDKPALCSVRISKAAKGKLEIIAERKGVSLGNAVSLIILHYAANNLDYEVSVNDAYKTILNKLTGVDIKLSKIIGPVERTEDFIKSLVREDRRSASGSFSGTSQDMDASDVPAPSSDDRLPRSLGLLELPGRRILKVMPRCRSGCHNPISTISNANTRNYVRHAVFRQHPLRSKFRC